MRPHILCLIGAAAALSVPSGAADGIAQPQSAARRAVQPDQGEQPPGDLQGVIEQYRADREDIERFYDLPWAEERSDRIEQAYRDWRTRLQAIDFDSLTADARVDYLLLRNQIDHELSRLARDRRRLSELDQLLPFRRAILDVELARRRMEPVDPPQAAARLAEIPGQIRRLRERIEQGRSGTAEAQTPDEAEAFVKLSATDALRAAQAVEALRATLNEWFSFYDGYQPDFSWWVRQPQAQAVEALDEYARYLRETIAGIKGADDDPLVGRPAGPDWIAADLAGELLPYSATELVAIAERELAWCEQQMKLAATEMGLEGDWRAALEKVKDDHVPPGQQDDLIAEQVRQAIAFLKQRDLLTIPPLCEETWRLTMISPETQRVLPFAAYGGQNIMVAYPTESMKHADKLMAMRGNNRHVTRVFAAHELIPGHHLQAFMTRRHRPYRRLFDTPFFVEGWALYWEMTLWDHGYAATPEDRIGMLFWRMHRAARVIVSLKFHLGQMTPAEMVEFLVEHVGHERFGATSEVRRFIGDDYAPLYQCAYLIGGLQLRALRREVVEAGRMGEREFHDALLTYGPIPIELLRAEMLELPLTREMQSTWRFADQ